MASKNRVAAVAAVVGQTAGPGVGGDGGDGGNGNGSPKPPKPPRDYAAYRTEFPFASKAAFMEVAEPITVTVAGTQFTLEPYRFKKTGSLGYKLTKKLQIQVGGKKVKFQVSANIVAAHSKEAP
jgi:hypothetical protein